MGAGLRVLVGCVAAASAVSLAAAGAASGSVPTMTRSPRTGEATTPRPPSVDPFYRRPAGKALRTYTRGQVLKSRQVTVSLGSSVPVGSATQVLYRTTNELGHPTATVATIISPATTGSTVKLLSYQTAYDGLADTCRPSYQLQGGTPAGSGTTITDEEPFIAAYLAQGYTVVTSDYEGPTDDYNATHEVGDDTLDAILAAEHTLNLKPRKTPVGLVGYSGGSEATMWAAERQPTYAPQLRLNGVAAGGIPVDYTHNLAYISGSQSWGGAIPAVYLGLMRGYHLDPDTYLNAYGRRLMTRYAKGCLGSTNIAGLTFQRILEPRYRHWRRVPTLARIFNKSIMGRESTPKEPLMMAVGNQDGTGDGVMVEQDVQQLAYEYCTRGENVQLNVYDGLDHGAAAVVFEPAALAFLDARYARQKATDECSSITPGDPLTPIPVHHEHA